MKNKKLLFVASLLSVMTLASCSVEEFCGTNGNNSSTGGDTSTSTVEVAKDIYGNIIPDLDMDKAEHTFQTISGKAQSEGSTQTYDGEIAGYVEGNVAYGWAAYEVQEWYSHYGAAVKITFSDEGKALSVQIGVPSSEYHNFTPSYAASNDKAYQDYLSNLQTNISNLVVGHSALEIVDAVQDTKINVTDSEKPFVPGDDSVLGSGATQTETRTEGAVLAAAGSWLIDHDPINNNTFKQVSDYWTANKDSIPTKGVVNAYVEQDNTDANVYYSSLIYSQWNNYYGIALKATVDANKKITNLEYGVPLAEAHNYTPMYADQHISIYLDYLANFEKDLDTFLLNKDLTTVNFTASPSVNISDNKYTPGIHEDETVYAGTTQSYARAGVAIQALVNAILGK